MSFGAAHRPANQTKDVPRATSAWHGEAVYPPNRLHSRKPHKLPFCEPFVSRMTTQAREHKWSLDACAGYAKRYGLFPDSETVSTKVFFAHPYTSRERVQNERRNGLFRELAPKGASMRNYPAEYILSAADELNARPRKKLNYATPEELLDLFLDRVYAADSKPSEPVKDKRLRLAGRILDSSGRACCGVVKSGLRQTGFVHGGVRPALAICVQNIFLKPVAQRLFFWEAHPHFLHQKHPEISKNRKHIPPDFSGRTCFLVLFLQKVGLELFGFKSRGLPLLLQRFLNSNSHGNGRADHGVVAHP